MNSAVLLACSAETSKESISNTYRFHIVIENAIVDDYVTEKFYEGLKSSSLMVYLGAPNVHRYAPARRSFINVADFSGVDDLASYLMQVIFELLSPQPQIPAPPAENQCPRRCNFCSPSMNTSLMCRLACSPKPPVPHRILLRSSCNDRCTKTRPSSSLILRGATKQKRGQSLQLLPRRLPRWLLRQNRPACHKNSKRWKKKTLRAPITYLGNAGKFFDAMFATRHASLSLAFLRL